MSPPVIGYVVRMFPDREQVFVANEVLALERLGASLRIFPYRRPERPAVHGVFEQIAAPISRIPDPLWRHPLSLAISNVACAAADPRRYVATLRYVLGHTLRRRSLHTWIRFFQATHLARHAKHSNVGHLHAHFADGATRIAMLAGMLTGLPYSFTTHARDIFRDGIDRELLREKIQGANFVVGVSEYNRRYLEEEIRHRRNGRVRVVYNGIDLEKFRPDPSVEREPGLLLSAGRLVEKKGLADLIEACRLLRERGTPFRCEIVGDGPLRDDLTARVRSAGLADVVQLVGFRSQEELVSCYQRAAVFVLPAVVQSDQNRDALPTVLLEAMASGCPVISTRIAGIPEIIDDEVNGLLVDASDAGALAGAIDRVLGDAQLRARLGASARKKAEERFDVRKNVAELYRFFVDAVRVEPALKR